MSAQPDSILAGVRTALSWVSPLGWTVAAAALGAALLWRLFGWVECAAVAAALTLLFGLCCLFLIGRTQLSVAIRVSPQRVTAGDPAIAEIRVRNIGSGVLFPLPLDLPTGTTTTRFLIPRLPPGADHDELVLMPTERRGALTVGPAVTLRGDPLGLVRRAITWSATTELIVHPRTVPVAAFNTGVLRDLEGHATDDISSSDLAFHTLRDYVPGDDRRTIHWASTAKRSSAAGDARFMVRQFLDTRRMHLVVAVDTDEQAYADPQDFETALEVGASLARRGLSDGIEVTTGCGVGAILRRSVGAASLDQFARAEPGPAGLEVVAGRLGRLAPNVSTLVLVTGSAASATTVHRSARTAPAGTEVLTIRVDRALAPARVRGPIGWHLSVRTLSDLPGVLRGRSPR